MFDGIVNIMALTVSTNRVSTATRTVCAMMDSLPLRYFGMERIIFPYEVLAYGDMPTKVMPSFTSEMLGALSRCRSGEILTKSEIQNMKKTLELLRDPGSFTEQSKQMKILLERTWNSWGS